MNMRKFLYGLTLVLSAAALLTSCHSAKQATGAATSMSVPSVSSSTALSGTEAQNILKEIAASYTRWDKLSMDSKLKMDALPINPSMKVYMEHAEAITISLHVPIVGEVGRVELTTDSITIANRLKKVYVQESLERTIGKMDMSLLDVQDLLLGRVFLLSQGTLTSSLASQMDVTQSDDDNRIVTPKKQNPLADYGFLVAASDGSTLKTYATAQGGTYSAIANYDNRSDGRRNIDLSVKAGSKTYTATIECDKPVTLNPKAISPIKFTSKWKKVTFKELMQSF